MQILHFFNNKRERLFFQKPQSQDALTNTYMHTSKDDINSNLVKFDTISAPDS